MKFSSIYLKENAHKKEKNYLKIILIFKIHEKD